MLSIRKVRDFLSIRIIINKKCMIKKYAIENMCTQNIHYILLSDKEVAFYFSTKY